MDQREHPATICSEVRVKIAAQRPMRGYHGLSFGHRLVKGRDKFLDLADRQVSLNCRIHWHVHGGGPLAEIQPST